MLYVRCKHKKTGEERTFTEPVFKSVEHQYRFIDFVPNPDAKVKKAADAQQSKLPVGTPGAVKSEKAPAPVAPAAAPKSNPVADSTKETLQAQYKELSGKAAKGNWGIPRLTDEIKKLEAGETE